MALFRKKQSAPSDDIVDGLTAPHTTRTAVLDETAPNIPVRYGPDIDDPDPQDFTASAEDPADDDAPWKPDAAQRGTITLEALDQPGSPNAQSEPTAPAWAIFDPPTPTEAAPMRLQWADPPATEHDASNQQINWPNEEPGTPNPFHRRRAPLKAAPLPTPADDPDDLGEHARPDPVDDHDDSPGPQREYGDDPDDYLTPPPNRPHFADIPYQTQQSASACNEEPDDQGEQEPFGMLPAATHSEPEPPPGARVRAPEVTYREAFALYGLREGPRPDIDAYAKSDCGVADLLNPATLDAVQTLYKVAPTAAQKRLGPALRDYEAWYATMNTA